MAWGHEVNPILKSSPSNNYKTTWWQDLVALGMIFLSLCWEDVETRKSQGAYGITGAKKKKIVKGTIESSVLCAPPVLCAKRPGCLNITLCSCFSPGDLIIWVFPWSVVVGLNLHRWRVRSRGLLQSSLQVRFPPSWDASSTVCCHSLCRLPSTACPLKDTCSPLQFAKCSLRILHLGTSLQDSKRAVSEESSFPPLFS